MIVLESENWACADSDANDPAWLYNPRIDWVLNQLDLTGKYLFQVDTVTIGMWASGTDNIDWFPYKELASYKRRAEQRGLDFIVLLDARNEAPSYKYNLKRYMDKLAAEYGVPLDKQIIWSGAHHQFDDPVRYALSWMIATNHQLFETSTHDLIPTSHFVSLARIPKGHRILATVELLDRGLDRLGAISCGSHHHDNQTYGDWWHVPARYKDRIPMYIDGVIAGDKMMTQYYPTDPRISGAFLNIVLETSYDFSIVHNHWNLPFVTEKSSKPFAWGQVPVFIGPIGQIDAVRQLGLDMFDDLIDHSYANEPDPKLRINRAIDQVEKICAKPITYWQDWKKDNMSRFLDNRNQLYQWHTDHRGEWSTTNLQDELNRL